MRNRTVVQPSVGSTLSAAAWRRAGRRPVCGVLPVQTCTESMGGCPTSSIWRLGWPGTGCVGCFWLSLGCQSCVSVSRLQSADMSLDLTGPGTPTPNSLERLSVYADTSVYLYGMTDNILAGLLPALPPAADRCEWAYLLIAGEERRRHHRLIM